MNKAQADYCDRLQNGDIEVAVPCTMLDSLKDLITYSWRLSEEINPSHIAMKRPQKAYCETKAMVDDVLTGLGK